LLWFAIAGSVVSLVMMAGGLVWLGLRRELEVSRMSPEDAADMVARGWRNRPGLVWFRGLAAGMSFYGEKPTREIIALLVAGRFSEGLPWATPALGAIVAFFFWPLLIGIVCGLQGELLWGMVALFFVGGLMAAWPREAE
jgi:hypothetical protein